MLDKKTVDVVLAKAESLDVSGQRQSLGLEIDEDYHCKCLSCGAVILCGPQCCENFKSQYMVDNGEV